MKPWFTLGDATTPETEEWQAQAKAATEAYRATLSPLQRVRFDLEGEALLRMALWDESAEVATAYVMEHGGNERIDAAIKGET